MPVRKLQDLVYIARKRGKTRIAVAVAQEPEIMTALAEAMKAGFIDPVLIGDIKSIISVAELNRFVLKGIKILDEPDPFKACDIAAKLAKKGEAEIIVKGNVKTSTLLKAVLDKENCLVENGLLSHIAFFETHYYHKLLGITDAALNIAPDLNDKVEIIKNGVKVCNKLGIDNPKIGVLAAVEVVNEKIEATVHAAMLKTMNLEKKITGCIIDGPFALDNAVSTSAARHKGIDSGVAGDADLLLTPDINSGNILYKSLNFLGGAMCAAIVTGAKVPVVLTSRSDSDKSKFFSIAFAIAML